MLLPGPAGGGRAAPGDGSNKNVSGASDTPGASGTGVLHRVQNESAHIVVNNMGVLQLLSAQLLSAKMWYQRLQKRLRERPTHLL